MSLVKQLAGETVIYGLGHVLPRIFHFLIFSTYLTYRLSESRAEYAVYLDLYAYASLLIVLFSYRMDTALFRFGSKEKSLESIYQTAVLPMILTSMIVVIIGYIFSESIAELLTYPGKGYYVRWFSLIIAMDVIALIPLAKLRLQSKAKTFVFFKIGNVLITVALVLLFLEVLPRWSPSGMELLRPYARSDIDFVFLSNLLASTVMLIGLLIIQPIRSFTVEWHVWRKMVSYAWPLIIVGIAGSINQFFGVPLQKYFLGADYDINKDQAGIYGAVQKIPALLAMFTTAYNYAAEPFFFRNADREDASKLYGDIAQFFIVTAGLGVIGIFLFIDIFQYVIGPSFREGLFLVPILLMAYLLLGIYYNVSIWYKLGDFTKYGAVIASCGAIITVVMSVILLPVIGISASAYAALACYFVMVSLAYIIGRKKYPIDYPLRAMLRQIILITVVLVVGSLLRTSQMGLNLSIGLVLLLIYVGLSYFLEKNRIRQYI